MYLSTNENMTVIQKKKKKKKKKKKWQWRFIKILATQKREVTVKICTYFYKF